MRKFSFAYDEKENKLVILDYQNKTFDIVDSIEKEGKKIILNKESDKEDIAEKELKKGAEPRKYPKGRGHETNIIRTD